MRRLNILCILLAAAVVVALTGCRRQTVWHIGVSQCSSDDWREKMNEEILREALFHDNVEIVIRSADDSNRKQTDDIRWFADNGFDLIIASPNEADALTPVISQVFESGIPVILFDRGINGETYTAYQGADNREIGRSAAKLAINLTGGRCRAIEICGLGGSTPAIERRLGFSDIADDSGNALHIVGRGAGNWNYEDGLRTADSLLTLHPDANLIYAHNDRMAIAASDAARKRGRNDIKIIGIDAAPEIGIQAVADKTIDATFLYPTEGHRLVRTAIAILEGKTYERNFILPLSPAVDSSNAEMLLLQNKTIKDETEKIELLKEKVDGYLSQQTSQKIALYSTGAMLILFACFIFILLRVYWNNVRHHRMLDAQNRELEKQRDELNRLYKQVLEATQSRLSFFTSVSHDLRTPLTLIADPVEQIAEAENITEQQRVQMRIADKNVKILKRMINQILDFRKYEHGKLTLNLSEVNLGAHIAEWSESFRNAARKQHIKLVLDINTESDTPTMAVDVEKFERILFNLLSNAFKFTPANGVVTISFHSGGGSATLTVSDTGRGMTAEDMSHIFDSFFQTDKINPNGSGIGLTLVKAFVELHNGTITVESDEGRGSTFTVTVPIVHTAASSEQHGASFIPESTITGELTDIEAELPKANPDENTRTVLVIDDNTDMRTLLSGLLCDKYAVLQAPNGMQGIKLASKYTPDLVICDVMMPGIDGMETCRRLKAEVLTSHIPVLMLTACSMDEQRIEGYECGADAYLSKPFNSKMLLARCESLILNRKRIKDAFAADTLAIDKSADTEKPAATDIDSDFYRRFVDIVNREIANSELSVEDLAAEMGLSRVQFYRKLKSLTNYSPAELLRIIRLKRADSMLKTTEKSISEILYAVGFSSPSYFTKCYREYFGETPTDVQKRTSKIAGR